MMQQIIKKYVDTTEENKETIRNEDIIKIKVPSNVLL
jgi:hypothetical protein